MFEKHQHKDQFLTDMSQEQEINKFSEESQPFLVDMNYTETFELCENSAKHQRLDCNAFSEIGISYCSCWRNLKYSRSPTALQKTNCDFTLRRIPVEDQNMVSLKDKWSSTRRNKCLTKQDKANLGAIRRYFQGGTNKKDPESHKRSTILAKRRSCFSIASLLKDTTIRLRELHGCRTPNVGFFVWMLIDLKSLFDSDQNMPLLWNNA